jgi:hypothetical protein
MKKLIILIGIFLGFIGCSKMEYGYVYKYDSVNYTKILYKDVIDSSDLDIKYDVELPKINVYMTIINQKKPNIYIVKVDFKADQEVSIGSISLKICYNPDEITMVDSVKFGDGWFYNEFDDLSNLGMTVYYNDTVQNKLGYAFAKINPGLNQAGTLFYQIMEIHGDASSLLFSDIADEFEFTDENGVKFPVLNYRYIEFNKIIN